MWDNFSLPHRQDCNGIHTIPEAVDGLPYLYIEHFLGDEEAGTNGLPSESNVFVIPCEEILSSQFLRQKLADLVGDREKWDWAAHPTRDRVHNVIEAFSGWWNKHAAEYGAELKDNQHPSICFETSVNIRTTYAYEAIAAKFTQRWRGMLQYNSVGRFLSRLTCGESGGSNEFRQVLDVGCGPGFYAKVFADLGFECVAVDDSKRMLKEAEQYLVGQTTPNTVELVQGRLENLPAILKEQFEAIWYSAAFLHVPRRGARNVLRVLNELLSNDGVLYLSTRLLRDSNGYNFPALELRREGRVFVYYQQSELENLFTDASFRILEFWQGETKTGTHGEYQSKPWYHYLLCKRRNTEE